MASQAMVPVQAGQVQRQEFGATQLAVSGETAVAAAAATARAMVEARFVMALQRPRDWDDVRAKLLRAIERPGFAGKHGEKSKPGQAWFSKPIGDGVEGLTIRFAEEVFRCMGNVDARPVTVYEDATRRIVEVTVLDLESNLSFASTVLVPKTVERKFLKKGEVALSVRTNSQGEPTYTRLATEDEIMSTQGSLISKAMRTNGLRLLPGDIRAECETRIQAIRFGEAATNPDGVRKEISDAFNKLNVVPSALKQYLGHELALATPAELSELRELYKAIKDGKVTWVEALRSVMEERGEAEAPKKAEPVTTLAGVTEKLKAEAPAAPEPAPKCDQHGEELKGGECWKCSAEETERLAAEAKAAPAAEPKPKQRRIE